MRWGAVGAIEHYKNEERHDMKCDLKSISERKMNLKSNTSV